MTPAASLPGNVKPVLIVRREADLAKAQPQHFAFRTVHCLARFRRDMAPAIFQFQRGHQPVGIVHPARVGRFSVLIGGRGSQVHRHILPLPFHMIGLRRDIPVMLRRDQSLPAFLHRKSEVDRLYVRPILAAARLPNRLRKLPGIS